MNSNLSRPLTVRHVIPLVCSIAVGTALAMSLSAEDAKSPARNEKAATGDKVSRNRGDNSAANERRESSNARRRGHQLGFEVDAKGDQGLRVTSVEDQSAAGQAGLQKDDRIISADGRPFTRPRQLQAYLAAQGGRQVPIVIERNGMQYTVQFSPQMFADDSPWLGVYLEEGDANSKGARITQVYPAGPAARAGLRVDDVVMKIGDESIDGSADLVATVQNLEPNQRVNFVVHRGDADLTIPVILGTRDSFAYRSEYRAPPNGEGNEMANRGQNNGWDNIPPYAMQLEQERRSAEQHQRIEDEIRLLRQEIAKLREELKQK